MRGSYHLTIFVYYLGLWSRQLKSYPLSVKDLGEKKNSNTRKKEYYVDYHIFTNFQPFFVDLHIKVVQNAMFEKFKVVWAFPGRMVAKKTTF